MQYQQVQDLHEDHTEFEKDKLPPRASFFSFPSSEEENKEASSRYLKLNGNWKFKWVKSPEERFVNFYARKLNDNDWDSISVPGNWEVEGFGKPIYLDERYPFEAEWPDAPEDYNPVGSYRHRFEFASELLNGRQILHFAGAKSAMYVYLNGEFVGYSQGSKTPAEFDVTGILHQGENLIAMQMYRWSDASYLESQDMLRLSGIEREVYIYSTPDVYINDVFIQADYNITDGSGDFKAGVVISNSSYFEAKRSVGLTLGTKTPLFEGSKEITLAPENSDTIWFSNVFKNVDPWSAEMPSLYDLEIKLLDTGSVENNEFITQKVGFRNIEILNGQLLVNGQPIAIKGGKST